ncbi:MAG: prenyltransferase/squalene oxidase repeat-containing protein [Algisphaera sp.]
MIRPFSYLLAAALLAPLPALSARALDAPHRTTAHATVAQGIAFLRSIQQADGSWSPQPGPAVTGLVVALLLDEPDIGPDDPAVARGVSYLLDRVQSDGSIRDGADGILANYNTAICLSALTRLPGHPQAAAAVQGAQRFLINLQWKDGMTLPSGEVITADHPFYGGAGYGQHGRPDMSNTQIMLQGLYDAGLDCDDPAFQRALTFISRCQGIPQNTYFAPGTLENKGGVIYATAINGKHPHIPVSYANPQAVDEARAGQSVSGLRGYGSMTYAAFKSFVYANLAANDPRVVAAQLWIETHYTLDQNPGLPEAFGSQGLYYYYLTHARALSAWGQTHLNIPGQKPLDWANALIDQLASQQQPDGSFVNSEPRWMEDDAALVTAYALTALQHAAP